MVHLALAEDGQVVAAAEALAGALDHDDVHLVRAFAHSTAARISRGISSLIALRRSGRSSSRRAMRGWSGSWSMRRVL
jgi:hypothetical protein